MRILIIIIINISILYGQNNHPCRTLNINRSDTDFHFYIFQKYGAISENLFDRNKLIPLRYKACFDTIFMAFDSLEIGNIQILITKKKFSTKNHNITPQGIEQAYKIDGYMPHGVLPKQHFPNDIISRFEVKINKKKVQIPDSVFLLIANLNLCNYLYNCYEPLQAYYYDSKIIIYMWGGDVFYNLYIAKFVLANNRTVTIQIFDINHKLSLYYLNKNKNYNY